MTLRPLVLLMLMPALAAVPLPAMALTIARDGRPCCAVVVAGQASRSEKTAAAELAHYLGRMTGAAFAVTTERETGGQDAAPAIYVGDTAYARRSGIEAAKLAAEEWVVRQVRGSLIVAGGRPRGTLYGAYHFLEDVAGVHWWTPWEESVPNKPTFAVDHVSLRGRPFFRYRDIFTLYGADGGRFAARNRLNRQGDAPISPDFGGAMAYGPPYHVHTFSFYIPPERYFKTHPEWFALVDGRRKPGRGQLCLTNASLREAVLAKLKGFIETSRAAARAAGVPPPAMFSISQNDVPGPCQCSACQAIARREDSEAGPLLDFVNYLAAGIGSLYPDVFIDTLAYQYTQKPPRTMRARDNVIVRLCNTRGNLTRAVTHRDNARFRQEVLAWAGVTRRLHIWTYAVTYDRHYGLPLPTMRAFSEDARFYADSGVQGVFIEHERPVVDDMRDLKIWMSMKQLENPYASCARLAATFTDGYYGAAGKHIRDYLDLLDSAAAAKGGDIKYYSSLRRYRYLTFDFLRRAQEIFDRAAASAAGDPVLARRVRHARLSLDRATLVLLGAGRTEGAVSRRYWRTVDEQIDLRMPPEKAAREKQNMRRELKGFLVR